MIDPNSGKAGNKLNPLDITFIIGKFVINFLVLLVIFYIYTSYIKRKYEKSNIEGKLDKIIELLEKDKKN